MITKNLHKDVYDAFMACRKIYGTQDIHVQLLAKQLGVLPVEVIKHIDLNPTLFATKTNQPNSGYESKQLGNDYPGLVVTGITQLPYLATANILREGDSGLTLTLTISSGTFAASTSTSNWTVDVGTTGLTFASVNTGTTSKVLTFTGTIKPGTLSVKALNAVLTVDSDSDVFEINVQELSLSQSYLANIQAQIDALEARVDLIENP